MFNGAINEMIVERKNCDTEELIIVSIYLRNGRTSDACIGQDSRSGGIIPLEWTINVLTG